jgi:hypothetical protein
MTPEQPPVAGPPRADPVVDREGERLDYPRVRERIRDLVRRAVPAGATVVVVSKGDGELVQFEGRTGWHFPRDDSGQYAGYHPKSGEDAAAHLEALRALGGDYFVVPRTYFWWFEQYPELAGHLEAQYRLVAREEDAGAIFSLNDPHGEPQELESERAATVAPPRPQAPHDPLLPAIRALVSSLLPEDAVILVASEGKDDLLDLGRASWHFPRDDAGRYVPLDEVDDASAVAQLETLRARGARYLLVPSGGSSSLEGRDQLRDYLVRRCRTVAVRERICSIFELGVQAR